MAQQYKTLRELDAMRAKAAPANEAQIKENRKEKPNIYEAKLFIEVSRCTSGNCVGLFAIHQLEVKDRKGKELKHPVRKLLIRDVHRDSIECEFGRAIHEVFFG